MEFSFLERSRKIDRKLRLARFGGQDYYAVHMARLSGDQAFYRTFTRHGYALGPDCREPVGEACNVHARTQADRAPIKFDGADKDAD